MTAADNPNHAYFLHRVTPGMIRAKLAGKFPETDVQSALGMLQQGRGAVFVNRAGGMIILHDRGEDIEGSFHVGPNMLNAHNIEVWRQYAAHQGAKTITGYTASKRLATIMQRYGFRLLAMTPAGEYEMVLTV